MTTTILSPNHPTNLRKQARATLDTSFSVRSYLGAAAALLEKAESSDRQGHLEQAFVNYIKAANVASFITKHPEWPKIQADRGPTWSRYQDFMQRVTDVITRATRIENTLREREEHNARNAEQQRQQQQTQRVGQAQDGTSRSGQPDPPPPPPAEPGPAKQLRSDQADQGNAAAALARASILPPKGQQSTTASGSATPVLTERPPGGGEQSDHVATLADRLSALRTGGLTGSGGGVPMSKRLSEPMVPGRGREEDRSGGGREQEIPTASQFAQSYPSLDELDKAQASDLPSAPTSAPGDDSMLPSAPSHAPGRRPLPNPPAPPNDLTIGRDVPKPFSIESPRKAPPQPPASSSSSAVGSPSKPRPARPASLVPGSSSSASAPKARPMTGPSDQQVGTKPSLPRGNHIKVEELWQALNPGFERVGEGSESRMVRKRGLEILLLDLRSRQEFEKGRVAPDAVCLEGSVLLRPDMTSADIEDRLLLAPPAEQHAFTNRHKYDAVVLYDRSSRLLGPPNPSNPGISGWPTYDEALRSYEHLEIVRKAIFEQEFTKALKSPPLLLVGGWESWSRKVGTPPSEASAAASNGRMPRTSGGSMSAGSSSPEELLKRQRRQGFMMPDGKSPPLGLVPGGGFAAPSMPAKAYQTPGAAPPSGAPGYPPTAASNASGNASYLPSQPSIPYGEAHHVSPTLTRHGSGGGFDYPQLRSNIASPPAAVSSNGVSTRSTTSHAVASTDISQQRPKALSISSAVGAGGSRANIRMLPSFDDLRIGLTGLKNVGNSCYQNATLQCLSATIPLAKFMLDGSYKRDINKVNPLGTQGALAESFAHLVKVMWSEQYTFVSPVTFREAISKFAPTFRGFEQHDSQEFLAFLLDGLHEDLNRVVNKPPPVDMTPQREEELETLPQQVASVKEWTIYRQRNDSLIVDWFQGQFRNRMTCLTCGKTSTTYNAFMYLSLPIPQGRSFSKVTLYQCLDSFVREEVMDKADAWNCPVCKKPRKATKRLSISRLPIILLIHLKRFSFKGPFTDKIETQVNLPVTGLDLTNYMPPPLSPALAAQYAAQQGVPVSRSQVPPFVFDLFACSHHAGSLSSGHYTASIRNGKEGGWTYIDDSRVTNGGLDRLEGSSPYLLFYRRR